MKSFLAAIRASALLMSLSAALGLVVADADAAPFGISVQGNKLVDGNGNPIQLRGVVYGGYDFTAVEGWDPTDPSGGQAGQPDGPNLPAIVSWGANVLRLPLNEASWLGLSCYEPNSVPGQPKSADPGNNYQSAVETQVQEANAAGSTSSSICIGRRRTGRIITGAREPEHQPFALKVRTRWPTMIMPSPSGPRSPRPSRTTPPSCSNSSTNRTWST